jgi:hypothetical protein
MQTTRDVMQVCRNGHVITDLLHTYPERGLSHCERCGAETLDRCQTCGRELPGAALLPGLVTLGGARAPQYCADCGAAFPWTNRQPQPAPEAAPEAAPELSLEALLHRLPVTVRQLRTRHGNRSPFRVQDVYDLEDLLRAVLPLHFDEVRPERRTPAYALGTRTDFLVRTGRDGVTAVVVKHATAQTAERQVAEQLEEDATYYERHGRVSQLVTLVYDPEGRLREPRQLEALWSKSHGDLVTRCVIAS